VKMMRLDNYVFNMDAVAWAEYDAYDQQRGPYWVVTFSGVSAPVHLDYDASRAFGVALSEVEDAQKGKRPASWR
jgi:hypothetical protein